MHILYQFSSSFEYKSNYIYVIRPSKKKKVHRVLYLHGNSSIYTVIVDKNVYFTTLVTANSLCQSIFSCLRFYVQVFIFILHDLKWLIVHIYIIHGDLIFFIWNKILYAWLNRNKKITKKQLFSDICVYKHCWYQCRVLTR